MKNFFHRHALAACLLLQAAHAAGAEAPAEIQVFIAEQTDANGKPMPAPPVITGIVGLLAAESGLNLVVHPYPWRRAQMMAENGEGLLLGAAITQERLRVFNFTRSLYSVHQWLVSSAQAPLVFQQWDDLRGKVISVLGGGKFSAEFEERRGKLFTVEQNATTTVSRLKMLTAKRVDAVMIDSVRSAPVVEAKLNCLYPDGGKWVVADKPLDTEPTLIAVPKSSPLNGALPALNDAIDRLVKSHGFQKIQDAKAPGAAC